MSTQTSNELYLGQIVDTALSVGNLSNPVESVLQNSGVVVVPALVAGGNATAANSIVLSLSQINAMQYAPLVIKSESNGAGGEIITLEPQGATSTVTVAQAMQDALNLTVAGQVAFIQIAQANAGGAVPGIINLSPAVPLLVAANVNVIKRIQVTATTIGTPQAAVPVSAVNTYLLNTMTFA